MLARLTNRLGGGDILLLHDGHVARTPQGTPVILAVLPRLLAALARRGADPGDAARHAHRGRAAPDAAIVPDAA